jgi:rare lipoprotein A
VEPRSKSGNPPFYEVFGKRYFVLPTSAGYAERGVASWYGPGFHGNRTANGERYDMHAMTAAHRTLPLPCYVQVTNLSNGRSVVLRVNDRGPFHDNRIIDLSRSAAEKLDVIRAGTALVEVRAIDVGTTPAPASTAAPVPNSLYVQGGAFSEQTNADALAGKLRAAGLDPVFVRRDTVNGRALFRVRVGPISSVSEFDRIVEKLKAAGIADARLALD